jgi:phosphotransferase system IIA component
MAEFVQQKGTDLITQFGIPTRGTMLNRSINTIPPDAVYNSNNIFIWDGKVRARAGLAQLNATLFADRVVGGGLAVTPSQNVLLAITKSNLYELNSSVNSWNSTSALTFTANTPYTVVDTAGMETSGQFVVLIASEGFRLKAWESLTHTTAEVVPTTGVVPLAKSVCIVGRRVVTLTPPHTINWSEVFDYHNWNALSYNKLAQTNDNGIAVRSIGSLGLAVYKERSIYVGRVTGKPFGEAFSFGEPILAEGPAGVHAIAGIPQGDMYMTRNGRIGIFSGSSYPTWIADGVWRYLQQVIHPGYAYLIKAVYDYRLHTVNFYYPHIADPATLQGLVVVNLPLEGQDIEGFTGSRPYVFLGRSNLPVTFATELRFAGQADRSIIFTSQGSIITSHYQDINAMYDGNMEFQCSMQTGLAAMPQLKHTNVMAETMLERGNGYGTVTIEPVISYQLAEKDGVIPDLTAQTINLEFDPVNEYIGFNLPARYFGLRYTWSSRSLVRYAGSNIYGKGVA